MDEPEVSDRWSQIYLELRAGVHPVESRPIDRVTVDRARLMFVDPETLKDWKHEDTIDGKADFVFWGKDARIAATTFNAGHMPDESYGWANQPLEQIVEMGLAVHEYRDNAKLHFATDFRPHSHHYEMMRMIRASETESGTLTFDNTATCAFMTSWGDGFFPVLQDLDAEGNLVRVRIEFATEVEQ